MENIELKKQIKIYKYQKEYLYLSFNRYKKLNMYSNMYKYLVEFEECRDTLEIIVKARGNYYTKMTLLELE